MKINEDFLEKSTHLYNVINSNKLYKKLSWVVNYENKQCVSNKISDDSKISLDTFSDDSSLRIYGSEKSNGISDFCKVTYKICNDVDKKVEKMTIMSMYFIILNSQFYHLSHWNPHITADKKVYIEIYE